MTLQDASLSYAVHSNFYFFTVQYLGTFPLFYSRWWRMHALQWLSWDTVIFFFAWEVTWGRILTTVDLQLNFIILVNQCFFSSRKLLNLSIIVWYTAYGLDAYESWFIDQWGLLWVIGGLVDMKLNMSRGCGFYRGKKDMCGCIVLATFWVLWEELNKRVF